MIEILPKFRTAPYGVKRVNLPFNKKSNTMSNLRRKFNVNFAGRKYVFCIG